MVGHADRPVFQGLGDDFAHVQPALPTRLHGQAQHLALDVHQPNALHAALPHTPRAVQEVQVRRHGRRLDHPREASEVGAGQVSQDYATVNDSAQAFGAGSVDNTANDTSDSHYTESYSESADHSFNDRDS